MIASDHGNLELVKLLLKAGADINAKDKNGWTALVWASQSGQTEIEAFLREIGANVNNPNELLY